MRYQSESIKLLLEDIYYNRETGELFWKESTGRCDNSKPLGSNNKGYKRFSYKGMKYYIHWIIYVIEHGTIDTSMIVDHIDGNRQNNHISNLRLCSHQRNAVNRHAKASHNESGWPWVRKPVKAVYRYYMTHKGVVYSKSGFPNAVSAYAEARKLCIELNGNYCPSLDHLDESQLEEYTQYMGVDLNN